MSISGLVHANRHGPERRHGVGNHQRVRFAGGAGNRDRILNGSGGCLGVHERHHLRLFAAHKFGGFFVAKNFAPGFFQANDARALPAAHFRQAVGKEPGGEYRQRGTRLNEACNRCFHSGRTRAGNGERHFVAGSEDRSQHGPHLPRYLKKVWIQGADHRLRQDFVNGGLNHRGTRPEK